MFKPDEQIKERPPCQNGTCDEGAIILYAGKFVCGYCASKMQNNINKYMFEKFGK